MPVITNQNSIEVVYLDDSKERIVVKTQLIISELYEFVRLTAANDTPALVALCCNKPREWVDKLKLQSFRALARLAVNANFPAAMELVQDDPVAAALLAPFLLATARAEKLLLEIQPAPPTSGPSISPGSNVASRAPVPSESAEATGNGSSTP